VSLEPTSPFLSRITDTLRYAMTPVQLAVGRRTSFVPACDRNVSTTIAAAHDYVVALVSITTIIF